jgi:hypothetical protein
VANKQRAGGEGEAWWLAARYKMASIFDYGQNNFTAHSSSENNLIQPSNPLTNIHTRKMKLGLLVAVLLLLLFSVVNADERHRLEGGHRGKEHDERRRLRVVESCFCF